MQTLEYRTRDKSEWGDGPWQDEPDKKQWQDQATGLPCLIVRGPAGALCGYVGVPPGHPLHGKDYETPDVSVHGGLTFAGACHPMEREDFEKWQASMLKCKAEIEQYPTGDAAQAWREKGHLIDDYEAWRKHAEQSFICHLPAPGEPDHVWWFGFDCAHFQDLAPKMAAWERRNGFTEKIGYQYRDLAYVTAQVEGLAKQLAAVN